MINRLRRLLSLLKIIKTKTRLQIGRGRKRERERD